jgi:hypothetical protein
VQRVFKDALISGAALIILLIALVAIDDRVRARVEAAVQGDLSSDLRSATSMASEVANVLVIAARDQSIDHAPMVVFVFAATVLVLGMLRL